MYYNLKALIKAIRATKTIADERAVIQKESAAIRTSFKEEDSFARHHNIAKLLYIHMLGYPAHFGQIECLKLVASPKFADKRLGYLGIMLLLDENQEVLTLVTNSLKNDMNHANMYIVGLALCTFANISSEEMARDLSNEVEKLMGGNNTYIRKKASLCAMRIVRKVPDLLDHFIDRASALLSDRNHGVLLCGVTLVTDMCALDPNALESFRATVPLLVRHLKALVTTGYSPEHDVSGITDPFLQVKILRLLRLLGKDDPVSSEAMNDILAQVATNTESTKNVGNSILYEAVLTILDIEAESGLRVMAINILGKFLGNRDNNIRYVALNTLNKVVAMDTNAVQRHRAIILDCLRDGDISIRRRALELSYALINDANVRVLTRELLAFLEVADNEFKLGMTTQICFAAERFAPNRRWHIDTVLRVLKLAGNYVREEVLSNFIRLVSHTPELQAYTVQKLYSALRQDVSQESLTLAGVWIIGEFGDVLIQGGAFEEDDVLREATDQDIIDLEEIVLQSPYANQTIRQFVLASLTKLSTRLTDQSQLIRIGTLMQRYDQSVDVEIQQRSVEFGALLRATSDVRSGVLERMPPPELKATVIGIVSEKRAVGSTRPEADLNEQGGETSAAGQSSQQATQDLLADIFGSNDAPAPTAAPTGRQQANTDVMGLFGGDDEIPAAAPEAYPAYNANGLELSFTAQKDAQRANVMNITATFTAATTSELSGVVFQAAVPKTQKLQLMPMSSNEISPGQSETQQMRIMAPPGSAIRLRIRLAYNVDGAAHQDQTDFSFPPTSEKTCFNLSHPNKPSGERLKAISNQLIMSETAVADIGLIGLAVMGQNLILNMNDKGYTVCAYNRTVSKVDDFLGNEAKGTNVIGAHSIKELADKLKKPRKVIILVKAGPAVDAFISQLLEVFEKGDIIIDGGNSHYPDTNRRTKELEAKGLLFVGSGVSGGEEGARHGPSLMPGGSDAAWPEIKEIFQKTAAQSDGEPCCDWVGQEGAGHYVKMVHNGIEYGDMQLICEAYDILKRGLGMKEAEIADVFTTWNKGVLDSFLIEITRDILKYNDEDGTPLVTKIADVAGQKGTGKWTAINALDMGMPVTLIGEAVFARCLSSIKAERTRASKKLGGPAQEEFKGDKQQFIDDLEQALYASKIISYSQGFMLMREAAKEYGWKLNNAGIALMWRGGCIIRSVFLADITKAFKAEPELENLLFNDFFNSAIHKAQPGWRRIAAQAALWGIPTPAFSTALSFFDGYRTERLPASLLQAQRDYFGAHTYQILPEFCGDKYKEGTAIHTNWTGRGGNVSASTYT
ncbi:hypothetical protein E5Q_04634 [Mixia osmundae IAM 14324]|uniref:6-phosphogluconate dehydrogenase, decarboxylating n=1 Tax=Mixia osmundae (strain CBS 9802 / IAM 14324 / JCM 22182 / KY 12970) TaxID=764103 RepID=G7E544_MIXOS|nr:hypothetical protein E5Q_04634 [Mixia osmundae IAM 14324]